MSGGRNAAGSPPQRQSVDGFVLLDKPPGLSSNRALQTAKRYLRAIKAGHAGTLDPMATGMLPLCFGQATKASGRLLGSGKAYRGRVQLGTATDTADAEGTVTREAPLPALSEQIVLDVFERLRGVREQVPPMYSALKRGGRPLYELARRGEQVERQARRISIDQLALLEIAGSTIEFEVQCSKGTYVRVLAEEIATQLGTVGHLNALRRLWVEPFMDQPMVELAALEQWSDAGAGEDAPAWLLPVDCVFADLPRVDLEADGVRQLFQGRVLAAPAGIPDTERATVYGPDGRFLGLVSLELGELRVARLFVNTQDAIGVNRA